MNPVEETSQNPLKYPRCSHVWQYRGKNKYVITCPHCRISLSIKKHRGVQRDFPLEEFKEKLRNAITQECPDCGCEKVDKSGVNVQYELFCECTNKKCQFTWSVLEDDEPEEFNQYI